MAGRDKSLDKVGDACLELFDGLSFSTSHDEDGFELSLVELFSLSNLSESGATSDVSVKDVLEIWLGSKAALVKEWLKVDNLGFKSFNGVSNSDKFFLGSDCAFMALFWNTWDKFLDGAVSLENFTLEESISVREVKGASVVSEILVLFTLVGVESSDELISLFLK